MIHFFINSTANGLPIPAYRFGETGPQVLVLGGVHGDEREGIEASYGLLTRFEKEFSLKLRLTLVPALNMDGAIRGQRTNARGVDLNRNMSTKDWSPVVDKPRYNPGPSPDSEPETRALIKLIESLQPKFVLSLHSWHPVLNINGNCRRQAEAIARTTGYKIEETIGYPTPGCLGTYCGLERDMPTLTYEIERGLETEKILSIHVPAILDGLRACEEL